MSPYTRGGSRGGGGHGAGRSAFLAPARERASTLPEGLAGWDTLLLPRGFAYTVTTPGPAEYLAICFPAFAPQLKKDA